MIITDKTDFSTLFHQPLQKWYRQYGRHDLPWRNTQDPYHIYVSEIMLQQTQVETVRNRYYPPFLQRFPTLAALAEADLTEVLKLWEGLGYYSRARNLHKAAQLCKGKLPQTVEQLIRLPGIGRNTAQAVAAFAYHQPVAVMEANVKRVLSRIFAMERPTADELFKMAEHLLDRQNPYDYNQAMMDLGAMVCTIRQPSCSACPAVAICKGKAHPHRYPEAKKAKPVPVRRKNILIVKNKLGQYYAVARTEKFLHGLYRFIELEREEYTIVLNGIAVAIKPDMLIGQVQQAYSHFKLEADIYWVHFPHPTGNEGWYDWQQLTRLPFSNAEKKILALMEHRLQPLLLAV